jgi:hypothetical protein
MVTIAGEYNVDFLISAIKAEHPSLPLIDCATRTQLDCTLRVFLSPQLALFSVIEISLQL